MNPIVTTLDIAPRQPRLTMPVTPPQPRREPPEDELRRLAFEIVQHDPVLAQLLVRAGERRRRN